MWSCLMATGKAFVKRRQTRRSVNTLTGHSVDNGLPVLFQATAPSFLMWHVMTEFTTAPVHHSKRRCRGGKSGQLTGMHVQHERAGYRHARCTDATRSRYVRSIMSTTGTSEGRKHTLGARAPGLGLCKMRPAGILLSGCAANLAKATGCDWRFDALFRFLDFGDDCNVIGLRAAGCQACLAVHPVPWFPWLPCMPATQRAQMAKTTQREDPAGPAPSRLGPTCVTPKRGKPHNHQRKVITNNAGPAPIMIGSCLRAVACWGPGRTGFLTFQLCPASVTTVFLDRSERTHITAMVIQLHQCRCLPCHRVQVTEGTPRAPRPLKAMQ
jgi:hypothetical protein